MAKAVEVKNLTKSFKTPFGIKRVLDEISFSLEEGEDLGIVGPNGSGKTTLLKILSTIYLPDSGTVKIFGNDLLTQDFEIRKIISFLSPSFDLQKKLTLKETLKFFAGIQKSDIEIAYSFLREVDMMRMLSEKIEKFSEGQKVLSKIAIGIMKTPKLFIFDEIILNLDQTKREIVLRVLKDLSKRTTFILVDHDPLVVDYLCESVLFITLGGKVLQKGKTSELIKDIPFNFTIDVQVKPEIFKDFFRKIKLPFYIEGYSIRVFVPDTEEVAKITQEILKIQGIISLNVSKVTLTDILHWHYNIVKDQE